jgi:hypothetical protein
MRAYISDRWARHVHVPKCWTIEGPVGASPCVALDELTLPRVALREAERIIRGVESGRGRFGGPVHESLRVLRRTRPGIDRFDAAAALSETLRARLEDGSFDVEDEDPSVYDPREMCRCSDSELPHLHD